MVSYKKIAYIAQETIFCSHKNMDTQWSLHKIIIVKHSDDINKYRMLQKKDKM